MGDKKAAGTDAVASVLEADDRMKWTEEFTDHDMVASVLEVDERLLHMATLAPKDAAVSVLEADAKQFRLSVPPGHDQVAQSIGGRCSDGTTGLWVWTLRFRGHENPVGLGRKYLIKRYGKANA